MPRITKTSNHVMACLYCQLWTYSAQHLTLSWWRPLSYRNQSIDLLCKSMDWFLYDNGLRHERFNTLIHFMPLVLFSTPGKHQKTSGSCHVKVATNWCSVKFLEIPRATPLKWFLPGLLAYKPEILLKKNFVIYSFLGILWTFQKTS